MTTRQARIVQDDWTGGSVRSVSTDLVPPNGALTINDAFVNIDGTVYERAGTKPISNAFTGAGLFLFDGFVGGTHRRIVGTPSGFYLVAANGTVSTLTTTEQIRASTAAVVFAGSIYIGGGHRFDAATGTMVAAVSDWWSECYGVVDNRLVWKSDHNKFRFSEINNPFSYVNDLGTVNEHTLPDGLDILGFSTVGQNLIVHTTEGAWTVQNMSFNITDEAGTPLHKLTPLDPNLILWGQGGMSSWEGLAIVPATTGIFMLDGSGPPVRISSSIDPLYAGYVDGPYQPGQAAVDGNHYFLPILTGDRVATVLAGRLDAATLDRRRRTGFPWTFMVGEGASLSAFTETSASSPPLEPKLIGAQASDAFKLLECHYLDPSKHARFDGGLDDDADMDVDPVNMTLETRDYILNALGEAVPRKLRLTYELAGNVADDPRVAIDIGDGEPIPGSPTWGDAGGLWGTGFGPAAGGPETGGRWPWTDTDSCLWTALSTYEGSPVTHGLSDGTVPQTWRIWEPRTRRIRFRLRRTGLARKFVLHDLELFVRPSSDVRRAR